MGSAGTDATDQEGDIPRRLRQVLGDAYTLEGEIGRGGMATVYRVHDRKHDRRVALKVLAPELAEALGAQRFRREIRLAAGLQHPHILPVFDSGEAAGLLWFTMPLVEGESLRDRLARDGQMPVPEEASDDSSSRSPRRRAGRARRLTSLHRGQLAMG